MALRDVMNRARVETRVIPVVGEVQIKRLSAGKMLEIGRQKASGLHQVLESVQIDGKPAFASIAEIEALDWDVISALIEVSSEVNRLPSGRDSAPNS